MLAAIEKAKKIKLLILDVDGVLTTGALYYGSNEFQMCGFHVQDGLGIKLLHDAGIEVAVISGRNSTHVAQRIRELKIKHIYLGHEDKVSAYQEIKEKLKLNDEQIACMGDDLPDLPLLTQAGLAFTVPDATAIMKQHVDYTTLKKGGKGAVREVCEFILEAQDQLKSILQFYLTQNKHITHDL